MQMKPLQGLAFALLALAISMSVPHSAVLHAGVPGSTSATNADASGLALRGYDPVAYFSAGAPTPGIATISAVYDGVRYLFATEADKKLFMDNPRKYLPEFGGFCAVGTAYGQKVDTDPKTGVVVNGKLYLNNNAKAFAVFKKDTSGTIDRAEKNWPKVKDQSL
jgi:YHS domain-containing protein